MKLSPDQIAGLLLGTAVGDALGLPREGLSARLARALFGLKLEHHFIFGRGMCSDDTEHAIFTAQAFAASHGAEPAFSRALGWKLRWWILRVPAGIGLATLRAGVKLWLGFSPRSSGVFSAGNGPAMRAPILGALAANDMQSLKALVTASTRVTHTDPKAEWGALAIAFCARRALLEGPALDRDALFKELYREIAHEEFVAVLRRVESALSIKKTTSEFAAEFGCELGVSGYILHTVPAAIFCWLNALESFERGLTDIILLGGDADTTGAIVGALSGATLGRAAIPARWIDGLVEWPHSVAWMTEFAEQLCSADVEIHQARFLDGVRALIRNAAFVMIVFAHGFRRMFPPYS